MDNFKLIFFFKTLLLIVILINWSCIPSDNSKVFEKIDLTRWNGLTEKFMNDKCPSFAELKKQLEPIIAIPNGMTFNTIEEYIQFRLSYRKIILDQLSKINIKDASIITIKENYQSGNWSSARIIITNKITKQKSIFDIIKDEQIAAVNKKETNAFYNHVWENDCDVYMNFSMISQMRLVTDFLLSGEYVIKEIGLY